MNTKLLTSLFLIQLAVLLFFVAATPVYESMMHPRFRILTVVTAYLLLAMAIFSLEGDFHPLSAPQLSLLLGALILMSSAAVIHYPDKELALRRTRTAMQSEAAVPPAAEAYEHAGGVPANIDS